jgi:hypothetical protein
MRKRQIIKMQIVGMQLLLEVISSGLPREQSISEEY